MAMANGLGRGLSSLIPQKNTKNKKNISLEKNKSKNKDHKNSVLELDVNKIKLNPKQPRRDFDKIKLQELADSIKEYGVIQPLVVSNEGNEYILIAGERRLRASKLAGLKKVPVIFRTTSEQEKLSVALVENLQRENLNPIEMASAYNQLVADFNMSQAEVARKVGKSRVSVTNTLRMLNLPDEVKSALERGEIGEGHAKYLLSLDTPTKQIAMYRKIIHNAYTVADTAREIKRMGEIKNPKKRKVSFVYKDYELAFREFFETRVVIRRRGKGGEIVMSFYDNEELENIVSKIKKK